MSEHNQENLNKPFYKNWVLWIVVFYFLTILIYTGFYIHSDGKNFMLASNELGDFLAGVFAPLAFLFLFLGYKQQGKELKLQAQELSNLVQEQKKQNKIYESQLATKRIESKPILDFKNCFYVYRIYNEREDYFEGTIFNLEILNHGKIAKNILITGDGVDKKYYKFDSDSTNHISFSYSEEGEKQLCNLQNKPLSIELDISYCDNSGYQYQHKIKLFTESFIAEAVDLRFSMKIEVLN